MTERRKFSRILYRAPALVKQQENAWPSRVLDLSLKGALLSRPEEWEHNSANKQYEISFLLHESDIEIKMDCHLVMHCANYLRLYIDHVDIDSASHLKRLVELNVGNDDLLHRELAQLADLNDTI